ncbi:exodeoxyribonuclease V subunit gamma [Shewanella eurypsychrophilus]|uniref:RecBCD enzyme subunit RecC n=1 Tax=Shewanella eurypsychrophilus TaxID=2593656 RepID=A0ABX6V7B0_9GAMM|nr:MULTISPECIES: exodeoxyribonuclease V subunit gamma [Shewanella]QFU22590.1 exodeoxyribonuclease V subunit gamma [Shewanella sp. YLB-09]QPG57879.1 exodeoxyribonuclease V subunit gamma [Shewanella eurypsychrophilus]
MLYLVQSNRMEALSAQLAEELQNPIVGMPVLMPEHVLVQSPGMSTWLRLEVAKKNKIAAALEFPLPSSFIWQLCHILLPDVPKENAFTKPAMTWKLMELLPGLLAIQEFAPLNNYLTSGQDQPEQDNPLKLFQLCGQIADIFDQYLVYRPDWIAAWEANEPTLPPKGDKLSQAQAWQPILWRALIKFNNQDLGKSQYHRANLHQSLFDALDNPDTSLEGLPRRLFVFGISSMAPQTLDVLYHLAKRIDVIMLNLSPCQHYWGDIVDPRLRARMALEYADKQKLEQDWEDKLEVGNPLLANNGKMGRELLDLILELPEEHANFNFECYQDPGVDNLLSGIQHDILELSTRDRSLGPDASLYLTLDGRRILAKTDDSLTLRSCHSPLREIETLHDHLLDMLSRAPDDPDEPLLARDIVIMLPDVAAYAPYIDAVFSAKHGAHFIPYAIADRGAAQESPLINSFLHILSINQSRFGLTDILGILEVPAVLRRFDLDDEALTLIRHWLEQAGVRWGRDETSRAAQSLPAFDKNSWAFGIKRLILGYAFSDDAPLYQDTLLVKGIEGQSAQALGKLLNFIETLDDYQEILGQTCSIEDRMGQLAQLVDDFYEVDDEELPQLQAIREAINKLKTELIEAGQVTPLNTQVLQNWFNSTLSESRVGQRYLAGSVNFCTLMPMRSIPFKVVCLVGMNDGVYPRVQHPVGFDLVAQFGPRKGDRSRRLDDRYLFLEAILSAREQLYISYIGHSERDNSERIPSMLVSELVEYCQLCYLPEGFGPDSLNQGSADEPDIPAIEKAIHQQLLTEQPLQPFDERLYLSQAREDTADHRLKQSYSAQWCPSQTEDDGVKQAKRFIDAGLKITQAIDVSQLTDVLDDNELEVSALIRFFRNPAQYFFNRTLKVDLSLNIQADDNDEPFSLNPLERYKLQASLLDNAISQKLEAPDEVLLQRLKASGELPLQPFDDLLLNQYLHDIQPLIGRAVYLQGDNQRSMDIALNFTQADGLSEPMNLVGRIDDLCAKGLVNYRPGTANGRDLIRLYIRHLCICAMGSNKATNKLPHISYLLDIGHFHAFHPVAHEQAKAQLSLWLAYFQSGQVHPLMFMPRTALAYVEAEGDHQDKLLEAQSQWLDEQSQLGEAMEPHYQRLFSFPDDFTEEEFGHIAMTLLSPMLSLYHKDKLGELASFVEGGINSSQGEK